MKKPGIGKSTLLGMALAVLLALTGAGLALGAQPEEPSPRGLDWRDGTLQRAPEELVPAQPDSDQPGSPAPNVLPWSKLTFQSLRDGNWEIYSGNDDGTGQTRLTFNGVSDLHPRLNRGASRIVFSSYQTGSFELYTMNTDGSGQSRLTYNDRADGFPFWSPDGARIVFESYVGNQPDLFVMNADGSGESRLTFDSGFDGEPAFSPDGSRIAWTAYRNGGYRIWVMNADGSGPIQLSGQAYSENPAWSPDGTQIAYDADVDGDGWQEVLVMNADGSGQHMAYDPTPQSDGWVRSWSPDGRYVAFTRISYIYYQGNWYWTTAYLDAWDKNTGSTIRLSSQGEDWYPDWQTADVLPPISQVEALSWHSPGPFTVHWSGSDQGPAGLQSYDVQVKDGAAGAWTDWQVATTATSASYPGVGGHTYFFRSRARDNAGNAEDWPGQPDASTTVEALAPVTTVHPLPDFWPGAIPVTWGGNDPGGSGILSYDVQSRDTTAGGGWTDWQMDTTGTTATFSGTAGHRYCFRSRGEDNAHNVGNWPPGDGQACVTFYTWAVSGTVYDSAGAPVGGAVASTVPAAFASLASDAEGRYASYVADASPAYTVTWFKQGYGSLPPTSLTREGGQIDIVLPTTDNLITNGDFEVADWEGSGWTPGGTPSPVLTSTIYHTGGQAAFLGSLLEFGPPERIAPVSENCCPGHDLAVDGENVVHAVWADNSSIWHSSKALGGTWSVPEVVDSGALAYRPSLAIDAEGTLHVVWTDEVQLHYDYKPKAGAWQHTSFAAGYAPSELDLATDPAGTVHLVWVADEVLYSSRDNAGTWSPPVPISVPPHESPLYAPTIAISAGGSLHVIWQQVVRGNHDVWQTAYTFKAPRDSWSAPSPVLEGPGDSYQSDLAADNTGTLHAVLETSLTTLRNIAYVGKRWNAPWTSPVILASGPLTFARIAAFGDGTVYALYTLSEMIPDFIWVRQKQPNAEWGPAVVVATGGSYPWAPRIAADATGLVHILWRTDTGIIHTGPSVADHGSNSSLAQVVALPGGMATPTLSFLYQLAGAAGPGGNGLEVKLDDGIAATTVLSITQSTTGWTHAWADLTPWAGKTITLTFALHQVAGFPQTWASLDEVSLGSSYPEVWVRETAAPHARPGEPIVFTITYGNRGGALASGVQLNDVLPDGLAFVSSDPPPSSQTPDLVWDVGDLPAWSGPFTITLTTAVAPGTELPARFSNPVTIATTSEELETLDNSAAAEVWVGNALFFPTVARGW